MTANFGLLLFLYAFWLLLYAAVKLENWWAGKSWSDGTSLFPLVPFVPAAFFALGLFLNWGLNSLGTWTVVGVHLAWVARVIIAELRRGRRG